MSSGDTSYFKAVKLGDFLSELPKSTLPASLASDNGTYPFFCSSSVVKYCNTYIQDKPTVLMGTGGTASVNFGNDKFAYSTDTWAFRSSHEEELKTEYIYRFLQHKLPKIDYLAFEGSGLKHLRKNDVKKLKLSVPANKLVTSKILSILRNVDTTIEKTEALIEKYQQIKAGLMHDLFTRGICADGKLRPPREQAPELYQETAIGWIPNEWELKLCSELCSRICVGIVIQPTQYYVEDGVPAFRSANIREDGVDPTNLVYVSAVSNNLLVKSQIKHGDILTVRTGYPGTSAVVPPEFNGANCIDILISTPNEKVTSDYLCNWINSSFGKGQVLRQQGGMAQQHFNVGEMRELLVALPKTHEQNLISERLKVISNRLKAEQYTALKLSHQKSGLMDDLLTGKVQVSINNTEAANV